MNMSAAVFPGNPGYLSLQSVLLQPLEDNCFPTLPGFVSKSQWRCEFLPMTTALQHQQGIPLHIKGPEWLVQDVFFLTDNYHKDKILQLFSPAVQNNLLLKVLLKVNSNQLISAKHCVNSGVVILRISKPAKQNTSSESILPFQNF